MARRIEVEIVGDASSYQRSLRSAQGTTSKFGMIAKRALIGGAAVGMYALAKAAKMGWDEYNQGAKVAAQTNAVIKSTGGVANVTAKEVEDLGEALMLKSGIDDEVIKSGQNVLLTFRNIRDEAGKGNMFKDATEAALDLSVAMGTDMQSAALQVGKALQDPIRGLTALRRVGVSFTTAQEDQIKALVESGETMKAQKIILRELQKEFGGSAKAAGETFGGQINIARERLNNFLGDLVAKAIPYLERLAAWIRQNWPQVRKVFVDTLNTIRQAWKKWGDEIMAVVRFVFKVMVPIIRARLQTIVQVFKLIGALLRGDWRAAWNAIKGIAKSLLDTIVAVIKGYWTIFSTIGKKLGSALKDGIVAGIKGLASLVKDGVRAALNAAIDALNSLASFTIHVPGILPGPSSYTVDFPNIPHVAKGGKVLDSGLAVVHRGEDIRPARVAKRDAGPMTVNLLLDRRVLASVLVDMDRDHRKRNGGRPLFA